MKIITTERLPIKIYTEDIEEGALIQCVNLANLPFAFKHIAIMPDVHQGYGMPIGGVLATQGVIIPNAVGVDIGCGMCSLKTSLTEINTYTLKNIMGKIREVVPVGFEHNKESQDESLMPEQIGIKYNSFPYVVEEQYKSALKQIGTLGGGNHFIEIQKGSDGFIWVMIHSGSRNLGKQVADYYNKIAVKLNERWFSKIEKKEELAFLPIETEEAKQYLCEMQYCVEFAFSKQKINDG
jgi:tRNA-splicing ligase RtcB